MDGETRDVIVGVSFVIFGIIFMLVGAWLDAILSFPLPSTPTLPKKLFYGLGLVLIVFGIEHGLVLPSPHLQTELNHL
jgi:hypothetical protein